MQQIKSILIGWEETSCLYLSFNKVSWGVSNNSVPCLRNLINISFLISVRPSLEPGWLEGILDGRVGLVPENYVEFLT